MVSFLTGFTLMCILDTNDTTRLLIGFAWLAVFGLVSACVWIAWESGDHFWMLWLHKAVLWAHGLIVDLRTHIQTKIKGKGHRNELSHPGEDRQLPIYVRHPTMIMGTSGP